MLKRYIILLLPFLFVQNSFAQSAVITGEIYISNVVQPRALPLFIYPDDLRMFKQLVHRDTVPLRKGVYPFRFDVEVKRSALFRIYPKNAKDATFFLRPGDSLHVKLLPSEKWAAECSGRQAATENQLLVELQKQFTDEITTNVTNNPFDGDLQTPPEVLYPRICSVHLTLAQFYQEAVAQHKNLDEHFKEALYMLTHYGYPFGGREFTLSLLIGSSKKGIRGFQKYIHSCTDAYDWSSLAKLTAGDYKIYSVNYTIGSMLNCWPTGKQKVDSIKHYFRGDLREKLLAERFEDELRTSDGQVDSICCPDELQQFLTNCPYPAYVEKVEEYIIDRPLLKEGEVFDFVFENKEGQSVRISDLKGRIVLLDIWATWCAGCLVERTKLAPLKKRFGDELEIVSLSVDRNKETWAKFVKRRAKWYDWHIGQSRKLLTKKIALMALPRYLLIASDGTLYSLRAPSPSGEELARAIEDMLGE